MTDSRSVRRFVPCESEDCASLGVHVHAGQWEAFWDSLTPLQREALHDKACWEEMSVMSVAIEWGVL